ncbi:OmpP1/FadL family transporter [Oceaniglobus ichthyenteri]|uniref:OmpP1/FadL family transporter n=1 Tax=Oceaniglobus ichthyenteri TaxID=2136177 RepID=UPI000D37C1C9|nr:hypothetical protein [Oceaniglobus ichthyenteri]
MKHVRLASAALLTSVSVAQAGGVDRTGQSVAVIFEAGNYLELSFGSVAPSVSGIGTAASGTPASSGDMSSSFTQFSGAYKHSFGNGWDAAVIFDQPFGAAVDYPAAQPYYARGSVANLAADALTAVLKYKLPSDVSLYGGLRYQTFTASATTPFITLDPTIPTAPYAVKGAKDGAFGYLVGAAYERPDIALRVALTYNSKIKHALDTLETSAFGGPVRSVTPVHTPQSVNLDFQTGVAANTLVFGNIRWVDWSDFDISPTVYRLITGEPLVSYRKDTVSYTLGIGRKLNDTWSIAGTIGYEEPMYGFSSNLGPTDGYISYGLGATYTKDQMKVTAGVRYVDIGDTQTTLGGGVAAADFKDNHAIAFGLKIGYTF